MTLLRKTRRCHALFSTSRTNRRVWFHSHALVAYIIDTTGSWLREDVPFLIQDPFRN